MNRIGFAICFSINQLELVVKSFDSNGNGIKFNFMSQKKIKVLIVDDERDVESLFRQYFRKELRSGRLEFSFAFSGDEAIVQLGASNPPEVMYVISDINMPGMSGLDLLDFVRKTYPEIKVSMISAYGDSEHLAKAVGMGAEKFFVKPIDFSLLQQEINQLFEASE
jgi:two-component system response regulator (stage 0 sporulation protein F)